MLSLMKSVMRAYEIVAAYMAWLQWPSESFEERSEAYGTYFHVSHKGVLSHFPQVISSTVDAHCRIPVSIRITLIFQGIQIRTKHPSNTIRNQKQPRQHREICKKPNPISSLPFAKAKIIPFAHRQSTLTHNHQQKRPDWQP